MFHMFGPRRLSSSINGRSNRRRKKGSCCILSMDCSHLLYTAKRLNDIIVVTCTWVYFRSYKAFKYILTKKTVYDKYYAKLSFQSVTVGCTYVTLTKLSRAVTRVLSSNALTSHGCHPGIL